jgi:hypothetical protein
VITNPETWKLYLTRGGARAMLLDINLARKRPLLGYWVGEDGEWYPETWMEDGRFFDESETSLDLKETA